MLLLTRLPTGPVLIAGSEEQKQHYVRRRRDRRAARRLRALGTAGRQRRRRHAHQGRARRRRLGAHRHQVLDVGRRAGRLVLRVRQDRSGRLARSTTDISCFIVERSWPGVVGRSHRRQDGRARRRHRRAHARRRARARPRTSSARSAASASRCSASTRCGRSSPRAGIGLAEGALMYAVEYVKQRAAFGKTIADMQGIQWKIAELATEIEAARLLTYRSAWMADEGKYTQGVRAVPLDGEVLRDRGRGEGVGRGAADARRGRLHEGPPRPSSTTATRASSRSSRARRRSSSG